MIELFLLTLATSVSAASLILWSRSRRQGAVVPAALPAGERTPLTLQVGDIVEHLDRDYLVEGALLLSEAPRAARLCRITDGATERFLYASTHAEGDAWLLEAIERTPESRAQELLFAGERLRLDRRWRAATLCAGKIGRRTFEAELDVMEYVAPTGRVMLLLDASGRSSAFYGERLQPHALEILPGRG